MFKMETLVNDCLEHIYSHLTDRELSSARIISKTFYTNRLSTMFWRSRVELLLKIPLEGENMPWFEIYHNIRYVDRPKSRFQLLIKHNYVELATIMENTFNSCNAAIFEEGFLETLIKSKCHTILYHVLQLIFGKTYDPKVQGLRQPFFNLFTQMSYDKDMVNTYISFCLSTNPHLVTELFLHKYFDLINIETVERLSTSNDTDYDLYELLQKGICTYKNLEKIKLFLKAPYINSKRIPSFIPVTESQYEIFDCIVSSKSFNKNSRKAMRENIIRVSDWTLLKRFISNSSQFPEPEDYKVMTNVNNYTFDIETIMVYLADYRVDFAYDNYKIIRLLLEYECNAIDVLIKCNPTFEEAIIAYEQI